MKSYLRKAFFFLLPLVFAAVCLEVALRKIPNDYIYKSEYLNRQAPQLETLILGGSIFYFGINPEHLSGTAFNASHVSQSLEFDLEILKKYDGRWSNLKTVVVPMSYASLFSTLPEDEPWRVKNYTLYYEMNIPHSYTDKTEILSDKLKRNLRRVWRYYLFEKSDVNSSDLGWGTTYKAANALDLGKTGKRKALADTKPGYKNLQHNIRLLRKIALFCQQRNIQLVLLNPPAYKSYVTNLSEDQQKTNKQVLDKLVADFSITHYINLLTDTSFTASDFYDATHLNELGAKKLSVKLDSALRQMQAK